MPFACSICEQESTKICAFCTKDACDNHLCERCGCCSDCCECEVPLDETAAQPQPVAASEPEPAGVVEPVASSSELAAAPDPAPQPATELPAFDASPSGPPETPEP